VDISSFPILSLIIFLPLVGAVVVALDPAAQPGRDPRTALLFALADLVASLWLVLGFLAWAQRRRVRRGVLPVRPGHRLIPLFGIRTRWAPTGCRWARGADHHAVLDLHPGQLLADQRSG